MLKNCAICGKEFEARGRAKTCSKECSAANRETKAAPTITPSDRHGSNHSARVKKITHDCGEAAGRWLSAGGRIAVMSWTKKGRHWMPRFEEIFAAMVELEVAP
jgi:hypothetical protein